MFFSKIENWADFNITEEAHKFFFLRWKELFDESTSDTWQVRSCNFRTIIEELIDSLEVCKVFPQHLGNIEPLIYEAKQITQRDPIVKKYFPGVPSYLEKIQNSFKSEKKQEGDENRTSSGEKLNTLIRSTKVLLGRTTNYTKFLVEDIVALINRSPEDYKKELYDLSMALAIEFTSRGYSTPFLRDSFQLFLQDKTKRFPNRVKLLTKKLLSEKETYFCSFIIAIPSELKELPDLSNTGIEFSSDLPTYDISNEQLHNFYKQHQVEKTVIATIKIDALDPYAAERKAYEKLENIFSIIKLYVFDRNATLRGSLRLVKSKDSHFCFGPDTSRQSYLRPSRTPELKTKDLLKLVDLLKEYDRDRLLSALQYHKLALSASTDEGQLVNLWIALESLIRSDGGSIISAICKYIPCNLTIGYSYKIIKALSMDINLYWKKRDITKHGILSTKSYITPSDLLRTLLEKDGSPKTKALYDLVSNSPLLIYRVYLFKDNYFKDKKSLYTLLEKHKENVEWQLRRIYRARNYVIHRGVCKPGTSQLIQHLHTYLVATIHNIIYEIQNNTGWTVADALEHRLMLYEYFVRQLREDKPISIHSLVKTDDIFNKQSPPYAWQDIPKK